MTRLLHSAERLAVFDPAPNYLNDHTVVRDSGGAWHLFGITAPEPARPLEEVHFLHASAPKLAGPWQVHEPVIPADSDRGETHVWAPYVIPHAGQFWMFFTGGTHDHTRYRIELATSADLFTWRREPKPLFEDGFDARDPMVTRVNQQWVMYYTRTSEPAGGTHQVAARTSTDLRRWSPPRVVFDSGVEGTLGGPTESPFVFRAKVAGQTRWILSVCDAWEYDLTRVRASDNPFWWESEPFGVVQEHCPEYVFDEQGNFWVTGAGWGRGGLHLRRCTLDPILDTKAG